MGQATADTDPYREADSGGTPFPWTDLAPAWVAQFGVVRVFGCAAAGVVLRHDRDAVDLIASAWAVKANLIALPIERLEAAFLNLGSGVAGAILQKFSVYGMRLAVLGDITEQLEHSKALRDFVRESNRRGQIWFLPGAPALEARLIESSAST